MSTGMERPVHAGLGEHSSGLDAFRESLHWAAPRTADALDHNLLRGALDASSAPLLIADLEGRIAFVNSAAARLLGQTPTEIQHGFLSDCVLAADDSGQARLGRVQPAVTPPQRFDVRLADGRAMTVSQRTLVDHWDRPTHVCLELEERSDAHNASALDLLGRLAGELAHDINNQLSAALNYVFVLQRRVGRAPEIAPHLDGLHNATWRAAMLANGLKLVARKRSTESESLQLDVVVNQVTPLLRHLVHGARVDLRAESGLPRVQAPLAYAEQLLITLALSALQRGAGERNLLFRIGAVRTASGGNAVRLSCELAGGAATACESRMLHSPASLRSTHHGALRRAVRLCHARLGHDARRIWVDFC